MQAKASIKRGGNRRKIAAPVGGLFLLLAVIGVATLVYTSIRLTAGFLDNDREKRMFENTIRPVVMFNPLPFETPAAIGMGDLLRYSMWAALLSDKRESYQSMDAEGPNQNPELVVPATDLDAAAARLFGAEIELVHDTFGDFQISYNYDPEQNVYTVPTSTALYVYSPLVYEITKEGEFLNLLVGYIPPSNAWTANFGGTGEEAVPDKYMVYVMRQVGDVYQIVKVMDTTPEFAAQNAGASAVEG